MRPWLICLIFALALAGCRSEAGGGRGGVVCLAPNLTELLFALGAGPQVVAVTRNDTYPEEVKKLPKVGDQTVDYEAVVALHPDLVVVDESLNAQHIPRLEQLGLPLCRLRSASYAGMRAALTRLAERTGTGSQARQVGRQLDQAVLEARNRAAAWARKPRVFAEIYREPLMTASKGTYVHEVLEMAGLENCFGDARGSYPTLGVEELLQRDPDLIVLTTDSVELFRQLPGWSSLRAVKAGHVYRIPEDLLVRPGPRLAEALPLLQKWAEQK